MSSLDNEDQSLIDTIFDRYEQESAERAAPRPLPVAAGATNYARREMPPAAPLEQKSQPAPIRGDTPAAAGPRRSTPSDVSGEIARIKARVSSYGPDERRDIGYLLIVIEAVSRGEIEGVEA